MYLAPSIISVRFSEEEGRWHHSSDVGARGSKRYADTGGDELAREFGLAAEAMHYP